MSKARVDKKRRRFLMLGVLGGAGLALGGYVGFFGEETARGRELWPLEAKGLMPDAWLWIHPDGQVVVRVNHTEMGQGVATSLPMILAEELDADFSRVKFEMAPAESVYKNPQFRIQMTAGSTSVQTSWEILRRSGAAAREMLLQAAAQRWGVPKDKCQTQNGRVWLRFGNRSLGYGELAELAAKQPVPQNPKLKKTDEFKIIGKNLPRLDTKEKVFGTCTYGLDYKVSGLLNACLIMPPVLGDSLAGFKADKALAQPGIMRVMALGDCVAIVARSFYQAREAASLVEVSWKGGGLEHLDTTEIFKRWQSLAKASEAKVIHEKGDVRAALDTRQKNYLEAVYTHPLQAHAAPETINCTAWMENGRLKVAAPTQNQDLAQEKAARAAGLPYEKVDIITPLVGGAFGRKISAEYVTQAVKLALAMQKPVKVIWTREQDMAHDHYRPANLNLMRASWDPKGRITAWSHRLVGPDHMSSMIADMTPAALPYALPRGLRDFTGWAAGNLLKRFSAGDQITQGAWPLYYDCPNLRVEYVEDDPGIPLGFWRSVAYSHNIHVKECFLDELAHAQKKDSLMFRLGLLGSYPRLAEVLKQAARAGGWGEKMPDRWGMGLACMSFHGTNIGLLAKVHVDEKGVIRVKNIFCAVDCGMAVHPATIKRQVRGGIAFGLTAALKSSITIKKGRVEQSNFHDFPLLRYDEMPEIRVLIVRSDQPPTGVGEIGVPVAAPAVVNAVFAATGKRIRHLPVFPQDLA